MGGRVPPCSYVTQRSLRRCLGCDWGRYVAFIDEDSAENFGGQASSDSRSAAVLVLPLAIPAWMNARPAPAPRHWAMAMRCTVYLISRPIRSKGI